MKKNKGIVITINNNSRRLDGREQVKLYTGKTGVVLYQGHSKRFCNCMHMRRKLVEQKVAQPSGVWGHGPPENVYNIFNFQCFPQDIFSILIRRKMQEFVVYFPHLYCCW